MSEAKDLTEIRQQIQQRSAEQKLTQRSTMSVPEMRKLLGLKKTDSYWLVHKNLFKTQIIGGMMRIDLESFEKWYADQDIYRKVTYIPTAEELEKGYICLQDAADLLGISREKLAKIARREPVAKSSKQRYVLIVRQSLPLQAIDRYSVQSIVAIKQGRIKRKPTEKRKKVITIIVSVYVLCVAVPTGLHTVSRNSVQMNVQR